MTDTNVIRVWRFEDAPAEYRALSPFGGDEDWLAEIPDAVFFYEHGGERYESYIGWCDPDTRGAFGCSDISEHRIEGYVIRIGAHA